MTVNFRTLVSPLDFRGMINHSTPMLSLGSCFAANIGSRLEKELFDVEVNPLGTLYNPASIYTVIYKIATEAMFVAPGDIVERDGMRHCWLCHSSLSSPEPEQVYVERLNDMAAVLRRKIANVQVAVLTFGTRHVYRLKSDNSIVANCHKMPASFFAESDLSLHDCESYICRTVEALRSLNPAMKIILTVSPVRYVGEGLHRSTLGKATLLLACEAVTRAFSDVIYFPSYEIMMDDLRDYRFYAADMKHPSEVAVDYIYDIFAESFFVKATRDLAVKASRLSARMAHRNICAASEATASFQAKTLEMARRLSEEYPEVSQQIMKHIQLP